MNKKIEFFVPVYKAVVLCHSELLDNIADFTKFVLWNIGHGKVITSINDTIMLGETVIKEEVKELQKNGLLDKLNYMKLTELGKEYFALIECFDKLEKNGFPCVVELVKGKLISGYDIKLYSKEDIPINGVVCERNTLDILMGNDNYENSLGLIKEYIRQNNLLEEQYMDKIYTTMRLDKQKAIYAKCLVDEKETKGDPYVTLGIPIGTYTYKKYFTKLDQYRSVLQTLQRIKIYNEKLLSDFAISIVAAYERECSDLPIKYYMNLYSGEKLEKSKENLLKPKTEFAYMLTGGKKKVKDIGDIRLEEVDYDDSKALRFDVNMPMLNFERH